MTVQDTDGEIDIDDIDTTMDGMDTDDTGATDTPDEITYEQALEWKAKAERLDKAEKRLVELKKQSKEAKHDAPIGSRDEVKAILAEEKFYDKNPEAEAYRKKIELYQKKGLSLDESYLLATKSDKEVEANREVYGKWVIKWNAQATEGIKTVSVDQFDHMTVAEQNSYTNSHKARYGTVKFK